MNILQATITQASKERNLYIQLFYDLGFHGRWKDASGNKMLSAPEEVLIAYLEMMKTEPIYRIQINEDSTVETTCYEMLDAFDPELKKYYETRYIYSLLIINHYLFYFV